MKKLWITGVAALGLWACTETNIEDAVPSFPDGGSRLISLTTGVETTRLMWVDGEGINWEESDAAMLGFVADMGDAAQAKSSEINIAEDGTATFSLGVDGRAERLFTYYPYQIGAASNDGPSFTLQLTVAAEQTQAAAGGQSLAGSARDAGVPFVAADIVDISDSGDRFSNSMQMAGSLMRFIVYSTDEEYLSETVQSVTASAAEGVALSGVIKLASSWDSFEPQYTYAENGGSNSVTVTLGEGYSLAAAATAEDADGIYMSVLPATTEGITYTVVTDEATYTFRSEAEKTFERNVCYNTVLNLASTKVVREAKEKHKLRYTWNGGYDFTLSGDGETKDIGYYLAYLDENDNWESESATELYRAFRFEVESENDWLQADYTGTNHIKLVCFANTAEEERTGTVKVWFDGDKSTYIVENADEPLFVFNVTQPAGSGEYEVSTVYYKMAPQMLELFDESLVLKNPVDIAGVEKKDLNWFFAYDAADDTETSSGSWIKNLVCDSSEDWCSAYVDSNHIYLNVEANAEAARSAVITVRYPVQLDPMVQVCNPDSHDTIVEDGTAFSFTITQNSGLPVFVQYLWNPGNVAGNTAAAVPEDWKPWFGQMYALVTEEGGEAVRVDDENSKYMQIVFDAGEDSDWLSGQRAYGNQIYAKTTENTTGDFRVGTLTLKAPDLDGATILGGSTIAELMVVQYPDDGHNWFEFNFDFAGATYGQPASAPAEGLTNSYIYWGSLYHHEAGSGNVEKTANDSRFGDTSGWYQYITFTYSDDWLKDANFANNGLNYSCEANPNRYERTGFIYGHIDSSNFSEEDRKVYGEYESPEVLFSVKVTQAAAE